MGVFLEHDVKRDEAPPHGAIGLSTADRISDAAPAPRAMQFRKRVRHPVAAIALQRIDHDVHTCWPDRGRWHATLKPKSWRRRWPLRRG